MPQLPLLGFQAGFRRFSVSEYHKLIDIGILTGDDRVELLDGYLINKVRRTPQHNCSMGLTSDAIRAANVTGWSVRIQCGVTLPDSEPEPDIAVVKGDGNAFRTRHPGPSDIGTLIEVADSTLAGDRIDKGRIYSRVQVPVYWIINLVDRQIEVYEQPSGPTPVPGYAKTTICGIGDSVPLTLDGIVVATFAVKDLLP